MNNKQLYKISKYSYNESFLSYALSVQGSNVEDLQKKMVKNPKYIRHQTMGVRITFLVYLVSLIAFPYGFFKQLQDLQMMGNVSQEWILFCSSIVIGVYCIVQWMFLFMLGMFQGSSILSGEQFNWLSTLPFENKDLQKISLFTFFRSMDTSVVGLVFTLPIGLFLATKNPWLSLIGFGISILNSIFGYSVLVIISEKMSKVLNSNQANDSRSTIVRVLWLGSYILVILFIAIGLQSVMNTMTNFIYNPTITQDNSRLINDILVWIPLGFSQGMLLGSFYMNFYPSVGFFLSNMTSFLILTVISINTSKKALKKLGNLIYHEGTGTALGKSEISLEDIEINTKPPSTAYFVKDKSMATRDIQFLMFILMALIFPSAALLFPLLGGEEYQGGSIIYSVVIVYQFMSAAMLTIGSMGIEQSGVSIAASLPLIVRDQAKAKLRWTFTLLPMGIIPPLIYFAVIGNFKEGALLLFIGNTISLIISVAIIELKAVLFGKKKYKYILEEYNTNKKVLKYVLIFGGVFTLYLVTFVPLMMLTDSGNLLKIIYIFLPIEIVVSILLTYFFNRLFPKPTQK